MRVKLVTGYVPIPGHPRTAAEYGELGERLSGVPIPKKAFYMRVEDTWLWKHVHSLDYIPTVSEHDNSAKNTLAYHAVNHQKSSWLVAAADDDPDADVLVWIDYGIFRLPGVNNQSIYEFVQRLDDKKIYAPGCQGEPAAVESSYPCWRFCGSMIAVPKKLVDQFDYAVRVAARRHIAKTLNVEWEVNTWARVEKRHRLPVEVYMADHNVSMFDNFRRPQ